MVKYSTMSFTPIQMATRIMLLLLLGKNIIPKRSIVCNWGDYRIPLASYEFGNGEFLPDKKFDVYGWATYSKAYWEDDKEAMKIEKMEWWK